MLSVLLFTDSDYHFGISKLFLVIMITFTTFSILDEGFFQRQAVPTKLEIYIVTIIAGLIFLLVDYLLVPECMVHPEVSLAALAWLIRNIYQ